MEFKLHKGYILTPGTQMPVYDIYETSVFESKEAVGSGEAIYTADNDDEASAWIDREIASGRMTYGTATQTDVDELHQESLGPESDLGRIRDGILLIICDSSGVQLFSTDLGDLRVDDADAWYDLGKRISESLPDSALK